MPVVERWKAAAVAVAAVDPDDLAALTHAVSSIGLTRYGEEEIYGKYAHLQVQENGLWQHPEELARALIAVRATLASAGIVPCRFLEVGTWCGATFWIMRAYFLAHINAQMAALTLDIANMVHPDVEAALLSRFMVRGDSTQLVAAVQDGRLQPFDFVFIDGDHTYAGVKLDTALLRGAARLLMYHDVLDHVIAETPGNGGGVPALWAELAAELGPVAARTVVGSGKPQNRQGFGIALLPQNATVTMDAACEPAALDRLVFQ